MIFRVTKGNAWVRSAIIDEKYNLIDPLTVNKQKYKIPDKFKDI